VIHEGPSDAKILILGEAPGYYELQQKKPFVGESGQELSSMLHEAGILRFSCYLTNVTDTRPPSGKADDLFYKAKAAKAAGIEKINGRFPEPSLMVDVEKTRELIRTMKPNLVIAMGDLALWSLTGNSGITKWRGSFLSFEGVKVIPTFNPAAVMKHWPWRWTVVQDLRRCAKEAKFPEIRKPEWHFVIRPNIDKVLSYLSDVKGEKIAADIETRAGQITCVGIAPSKTEAICIPFQSITEPEGYWSPEEEVAVTLALKALLTDPKTKVIWHNGLFDLQWFARQWGYLPNISADTQIQQHTAFPGLGKALNFVASMYCDYYLFWKDEGRKWNPKTTSEDQYWVYNCTDCVYTYESEEELGRVLHSLKLEEQYEFLISILPNLLDMMFRGAGINAKHKNYLKGDLLRQIVGKSNWLETVLGHAMNPDSHKQMHELFYHDFALKKIFHKKTRKPTLDDDALKTISERYPVFRPLVEGIQEWRSLRVFKSNFADAELDEDGRMRCSFNLIPETYRLSSKISIFGTGCNLQTIPKGSEDD
jgi:DNA polymerase